MKHNRWLTPAECLEIIELFPTRTGRPLESFNEQLFQAVARGDIRGMLRDVIVPKAHIQVYLTLYLHCANLRSNELPSDLTLSYEDVCAVFDPELFHNEERQGAVEQLNSRIGDRVARHESKSALAEEPSVEPISAAEAAGILLGASSISSGTTFAGRARRMVQAFLKHFDSGAQTAAPSRDILADKALHLRIT